MAITSSESDKVNVYKIFNIHKKIKLHKKLSQASPTPVVCLTKTTYNIICSCVKNNFSKKENLISVYQGSNI